MQAVLANAHPKKRFFIEMFTRDIPLLDCVLDLIDNCVDGLARTGHLQMHTVSNEIFGKPSSKSLHELDQAKISVEFSETHFKISDNCGGIDYNYALQDVFNFGHSTERSKEYLGVYGVGMKRALFKMGNCFEIESKTTKNGFKCSLDVLDWMSKDSTMDDWTIPLTPIAGEKTLKKAGTKIVVSSLKPEVAHLLSSPTFELDLTKAISRVYAFLIGKHVRVSVNGRDVKPFSIPLGEPLEGQTSYEEFNQGKVKVRIFATLTRTGDNEESPTKANSGWYVACNGRIILMSDTSEVTGWGVKPMPIWVPKYTSFIGLVFFESTDALELPWTTTKRSVNRESSVFRKALSRMAILARPILSFCNKKYPSEEDQTPIERDIAKQMKPTTLAHLIKTSGSAFEIKTPQISTRKTTIKVQYDAELANIEKIRKHLRKPHMVASKIGEHTFSYFLRQEGL